MRDPRSGGIESVRSETYRDLYSGWRGAVDCRTEVGRACNFGGCDRRFLYSVEGKTRAFTGEATGACSASMGGIPDSATVCLRQRGRFTAGRHY